jgi:putative mRNA 3-end processing factor
MTLLRLAERGLYCEAGDFYIDPWQPVERAVITHGHGDHARWGSARYLSSREGADVLRTRLGASATIRAVEYG